MKKLYLSIMALFVISAFLMAVESLPSEIVGYVAYDCVTVGVLGNNTVALPMEISFPIDPLHTQPMASDLGNTNPAITSVSQWLTVLDPASQGWSSAARVGDSWFNDFPVSEGYAYLIDVSNAITFYSVGKLLDPIQHTFLYLSSIDAGNNLLMVPLDRSDLGTSTLLANDIGAPGVVNSVARWISVEEPAGQGWSGAAYAGGTWFGVIEDLYIGEPLLINVTEEVIWP